MTITSVLLQTIGPALLPAADAVDFEYYHVLGLEAPKKTLVGQVLALGGVKSSNSSNSNSKGVSLADIRKAYKVQSLQWHPDKVAQRRQTHHDINDQKEDDTDPAMVYERIQEAATVLQDDAQRRQYHDYGCSVARYRFVAVSQGLSHPQSVVENIAAAPWGDKTRLLLVTTIVLVLVWIQPVLVATKINHTNRAHTDASLHDVAWLVILLPTWLLGGLSLVGTGLLVATVVAQQHRGDTPTAVARLTDPSPLLLVLQWLDGVLILVGLFVVAWYWDQRRHESSASLHWSRAAIPWWLWVALRLARTLLQLHVYQRAVSTMHSVEYIQTTEGIDASDWSAVHHGYEADAENDDPERLGADETQWQPLRDKVAQLYIVVQADATVVAQVVQAIRESAPDDGPRTVTPDELESIRVQSSAEYQAVADTMKELYIQMGLFVLIYVPLIALIVAKLSAVDDLDGTDDFGSWWIVFIPLWLRLGLPWLGHFAMCCCSGGVPGEYEMEHDTDDKQDQDDNKQDEPATPNETSGVAHTATPERTTTKVSHGDNGTTTETTTTRRTMAQPLASQSSDDNFASPEGDMADFTVERATETKGSSDHAPVDAAGVNAPPTTAEGEDDDMPELNEEAFRKWQEKMAESEMNDMVEHRLKAFSSCCFLSFQLVMLCLVVAKLEHDSDLDENGEGFNAFWVLFPLLLISGIILLCCSCSIYARPHADPNDAATDGVDATVPPASPEPGDVTIPLPPPVKTVPLPPPKADPTTSGPSHDVAADSTDAKPTHKVDVETGGNMDDLD